MKTGYATCEEYVANNPHAYDDAYVRSFEVYIRFYIETAARLLNLCSTSG